MALRTPVATPTPPSPRTSSPLRSVGAPASPASRGATFRPFTALTRERAPLSSPAAASSLGTPRTVSATMQPADVSVAETPTQARLQALQGRLQTQTLQESARRVVNEREKESKLVALDDKLSVLLASQEAERKRMERDESQKSRDQEERIAVLERTLQQLQHDFESEEQTRKQLNSTFAKNFAIKIEERFIKMEALVASQKRQLAEAEEARVRMMVAFESRLTELAQKMEQERTARVTRAQEDDENWKRVQTAIERIERALEDATRGASAREESVWGKVSAEISTLRGQMEQERAQRERDDDEKMRIINEGIAFIKDGKETWLRMFDYKMMPFKLQREEDEARAAKTAKEVEQRLADVLSKVSLLEGGLEDERRVREDEVAVLSEELAKETRTREATEEQISRLLEQTITRLEELRNA